MKAIFVDGQAARDAEPPVARRPVSAVMSSPVSTVDSDATLDQALRLMVREKVRHLVVLNDAGEYRGMVSARDIGAAWAQSPDQLPATSVASAVDTATPTVSSSAHVVAAARVMRAAGTDAVAVVDANGVVVGILTGTDLIALLARYDNPR